MSKWVVEIWRKIIRFMPFPKISVLCEMQSVSSRILTCATVSISCDDNHYTTGTTTKQSVIHLLVLIHHAWEKPKFATSDERGTWFYFSPSKYQVPYEWSLLTLQILPHRPNKQNIYSRFGAVQSFVWVKNRWTIGMLFSWQDYCYCYFGKDFVKTSLK